MPNPVSPINEFRSWRQDNHSVNELTIGRLIGFLLNESRFESSLPQEAWKIYACDRDEPQQDAIFGWPPDVFAICAAILRKSGCYASTSLDEAGKSVPVKRCFEYRRELVAQWQYRAVCNHSAFDTELLQNTQK